MGSVSLFVLLVVLLHFLRPETNPLTLGVSYYAVGTYGFLMTAAFLILSLGGATLTFGLLLGSTQGHRSPVGLLLLGIWSLSVALAAIFPIDAPGAPPTTHGMIHELVGTSFLLFVIAVFLLSRQFARDSRWHAFSRPATVIAFLVLAAGVALFLMNGIFQSDLGGLVQRMYLFISLLWLFLIAMGLGSTGASSLDDGR